MYQAVFLKPAPGRRAPQSDGTPWPAEGMFVPLDQYARRRIADGDLIVAEPPTLPRPADTVPPTTTTTADDTPAKPKKR